MPLWRLHGIGVLGDSRLWESLHISQHVVLIPCNDAHLQALSPER